MDTLIVLQGLIAARDGLTDAYKRLGFPPHEIGNNDVVLPKIETALVEIRQSTEHFEDLYEIVERDIDYDEAQKLGAAGDKHLWTVVEGDSGSLYVTAGWAYVNRFEYLLTKQEWPSSDETWLWHANSDDDDGDDSDEEDVDDADGRSDAEILPPVNHQAIWEKMASDRVVDSAGLYLSMMDLLTEVMPTTSPADLRSVVESRLDGYLALLPEDFRPSVIPALCEFGYRRPEHRD